MKIDPEHLPRIGKEAARVAGPAKRAPVREKQGQNGAHAAEARADGLSLSPGADRFRQLRARLEALPQPTQSERVARLKAQVDAGEYKVDAEQVAKAMLADEGVASALGLGPAG